MIAGLAAAFSVAMFGPTTATEADPVKIVAFGDSLTAGYGLSQEAAFPTRLEAALRAKGHQVEIINAGVSGDTASGGRARLAWALPDDADAVIVELGATDALRGIDPAATEAALDALLADIRARGLPVLLAGMLAPPNMGADYEVQFNGIFPRLAEKHGALFYPFFLDGVAADAQFNQGDGIHPNAAGVSIIVERMLPLVEKLIAAAEPTGTDGMSGG